MKKKTKPLPKKKKPPSKLSQKGFGFWLFLILFASGWMFVLGVFVGRDTAPVHFDIKKLQKELAALKLAAIEKEERRYKISSKSTSDPKTFGFYKTLKEKNNDAKLYQDKSKQKRKTLSKKVVTGTKKKRVPDSKKTDTGKIITIQVASLKDPKAADKLVSKLKKNGYAAYRITADISGKGTWHRVRIGYFKNKAEAEKILKRLKKENRKGILMYRKE